MCTKIDICLFLLQDRWDKVCKYEEPTHITCIPLAFPQEWRCSFPTLLQASHHLSCCWVLVTAPQHSKGLSHFLTNCSLLSLARLLTQRPSHMMSFWLQKKAILNTYGIMISKSPVVHFNFLTDKEHLTQLGLAKVQSSDSSMHTTFTVYSTQGIELSPTILQTLKNQNYLLMICFQEQLN